MKKKIIIWSIIILVIALIVGLFITSKNRNKYVSVKTSVVSKGDVKSYLSITGTIKSQNSKEYYGVQGKVKEIKVKIGNKVRKNDVLVTYDVADTEPQIKQAQLQYDNAVLQKNELIDEKNKIDDNKAKLNKQIASLEKSKNPTDQAKVEQLKSQLQSIQEISSEKIDMADNSIDVAKVALDSAKENASKSKDKIVADRDGVVTAINVSEGAMDTGAQPAVIVQDLSNLKVVASIGKYDVDKVKLGQDVTIKGNTKNYTGKVTIIQPAATKSVSPTGSDTTLGIEANILEKNPQLKIDFDNDLDILTGEADNVVKLPAEAIKYDKSGKNYVYIVKGDKAQEKEVSLGLQSDLEAQVLSGVNPGDKIILNPGLSIKDGVFVKEDTGEAKK